MWILPCPWVLISTCLLILNQGSGSHGNGQREDVGLRQIDDNDRIFSGEDLLWVTTRSSVVSCATACLSDQLCESFTVCRNGSAPVGCRGHSTEPRAEEGVVYPGCRLYLLQTRTLASDTTTVISTAPPETSTITTQSVTTTTVSVVTTETTFATTTKAPWLNSVCSQNTDCEALETNTECVSDHCRCTPGYFYSHSSDTCILTCSTEDLQDETLAYPGFMISGYHLSGSYPKFGMSLTDCLNECFASSTRCPSVDYSFSSNGCGASSVSRFDFPGSWRSNSNFGYYQRTCR